MRAIIIQGAGADARLVEADLPAPEPAATELVVRVAFAGLNRAELNLANSDHFKGQAVPGGEFAGQVVGMGPDCRGFALGDRVMGLGRGSHAEQACIDYRLAMKVPAGLDLRTAAALPACYMTAHNALCTEGGLQAGEAVLVQGAASGVGIAVVQLARLFGAGRVIGVGRSAEKLERLRNEGLDEGVVAEGAWHERVVAACGGGGADLIVDMVGGGALSGNLASAALKARIVAVGRLGGQSDMLDINTLAFKRLRLIGVSFRSRSLEERAEIAKAFERAVLPAVASGAFCPVIDRVFPLSEVKAAHDLLRRNAHFGKTLLEIGQ